MKFKTLALCSIAVISLITNTNPAHATDSDQSPSKILWQIGKSDNDTAEFFLAPESWNLYDEDAFYIVGRSDARKEWPYVHPGPEDIWSGGREHTFTVLFGLDKPAGEGMLQFHVDLVNTHRGSPPMVTVRINDYTFGIQLPKGGSDDSLFGRPENGDEYRFTGTIPASVLIEGINTLTIANQSGSWMIYDSIALEAPSDLRLAEVPEMVVESLHSPPLLMNKNGSFQQIIKTELLNTVRKGSAGFYVDGKLIAKEPLQLGRNIIEIPYPAVETKQVVDFEIKADGATVYKTRHTLKPVRRWSLYFLPHSHVDIGYTHLQTEVAKVQAGHIDDAIDLARRTADYPEHSQFKWNVEVLWPVDEYLRQATEEKKSRFFEAVNKGWIGLDALYGSMLTGLARPEELYEFTSFAQRLSREHDFTIDSAMITDVPGYVWGMVPALAQSGVRYFSPGPNHMPLLPHQGDRIGYTSEAWGDKPFYWLSPSGKEKVLVWIPTHGYSWFHSWILGNIKKSGAAPILEYMDELEDSGFPYDMVHLRYTIGADNGPPDPDLPEFVRAWNEKYAYPRMIIGTTGEMFREFERRYGDTLPEFSGDFTPYWEDGAASTSHELSANRAAAERIVQAQTLWSILDPDGYPREKFDEAWRNVVLFDEHTWGAHSSISAPESDFVKGQWSAKKQFAEDAVKQSNTLLYDAFPGRMDEPDEIEALDVYNTSSWPRTDIVTVSLFAKTPGDRVDDGNGKDVPSQRKSTGQLVFLAKDVPPFGKTRYSILPGKSRYKGKAAVDGATLSNGLISLRVDPQTGTITSLKQSDATHDYAETVTGDGLNTYHYILGRDPADAVSNGSVRITVKDNGPLIASLQIESDAPGCKGLTRIVRIIDGFERVDIINIVDKKAVLEKESVHFGFPFNVPDGEIRYDLAWGVGRPDINQLDGGNRNYFSAQRWVDVSNEKLGITMAVVDAPLIEIGGMNAEIWNLEPSTRPWLKSVAPSQTVYSYVMNNYWHTNYKASQEGAISFRYSLVPHESFDSAAAKRFGIERSQALVAVPVSGDRVSTKPLLALSNPDVIVSSLKPGLDGASWIVRLFNTGQSAASTELNVVPETVESVWISNVAEDAVTRTGKVLPFGPFEVMTIKLKRVR